MRLFDTSILFDHGKIEESIIVKSFQQYKDNGGKLDALDAYSLIKGRAKCYEGTYISTVDMACSGIKVPEDAIRKNRLIAQVLWMLLHLWFNKPLRTVDYSTFDLNEFNKL